MNALKIEDQERHVWDEVFDNLARNDGTDDGKINRHALTKWISAMDLNKRIDFEANLNVSPVQIDHLMAKADHNNDGYVDKDEFLHFVHNKNQILTKRQQSVIRQYFQVVAFAEEYRWWPPPWFTILITVSQIIIFVIVEKSIVNQGADNPNCSYFIYSPYRRLEIWRFLTYMFIHVDLEHLLMNTGMLIMVGLPLEMSHGSIRVMLVYLFGVVSGSLATSVCDHSVFLAGASGGIYALITAHLATITLNWHEDMVILQHRFRNKKKTTAAKFHGTMVRFLRLLLVILYAVIDTGWAIYRRYNLNSEKSYQKISVVAHLSGAVAGLLVGIIVLKNRKVHTWEIKLKILCIITYAIFIGGCILWNVMADSIMSEPFFPASQDYNSYENCSSAP